MAGDEHAGLGHWEHGHSFLIPDTGTPSPRRSWLFFTAIFLARVAAGVLGAFALNLSEQKTQALLPIARSLDLDIPHLKNGQMITERILSRNNQELVLEIRSGTLKLRWDEIDRIE